MKKTGSDFRKNAVDFRKQDINSAKVYSTALGVHSVLWCVTSRNVFILHMEENGGFCRKVECNCVSGMA